MAGKHWAKELAQQMRDAGRLNHEIAEVLGWHPVTVSTLLDGHAPYGPDLRVGR